MIPRAGQVHGGHCVISAAMNILHASVFLLGGASFAVRLERALRIKRGGMQAHEFGLTYKVHRRSALEFFFRFRAPPAIGRRTLRSKYSDFQLAVANTSTRLNLRAYTLSEMFHEVVPVL